MGQWAQVPWSEPLFQNADDALTSRSVLSAENVYANQAGGFTRFPGLVPFVSLPGARTFLRKYRNDLIATTDQGRVYRVSQAGNIEDVTRVPISGGRRPVFTATEDELVIAAGGPMIRLSRNQTAILSKEAPETTHVGFLSGYLTAIEPNSGRFLFSRVGVYDQWDPLDVLTAEGKPDDLVALAVTPYGELQLAGEDSLEQFEPAPSGDRPFARRWVSSDGVQAPYTFLAVQEGTYGVNPDAEFVRFSLQTSQVESAEIGMKLQSVDNWTDAWTAQIKIGGQTFMMLQAPQAASPYGTTGLTWVLDYRSKRWSQIYGWDSTRGVVQGWPGMSYERVWNRHFVGIPGGIAEMRTDAYANMGAPMRALVRTGHIDEYGRSRIDNLTIRMKRGLGAYQPSREPQLVLRVNRDNQGFDPGIRMPLGEVGDDFLLSELGVGIGIASTWQFEIWLTDAVPLEFAGMNILVQRLRR